MAAAKGLPLSALNTEIRRKFGVAGLYDLTSKQASELVDELKRRKAA